MTTRIDLALAVAHHLGMIAVAAVLVTEAMLLRLRPDRSWVQLIAKVDLGYGVAAAVVFAAGLARVAWGVKGPAFYTGNPVFWTKLGVFVLVGLLSIIPTLRFLRWRRALTTADVVPSLSEIMSTRRWVQLQLGLLSALPVLAAAMARGVGH